VAKIYTGRDGRLVIDGIEQVKIVNWRLNGALEVLETTTLGDAQRSYTPGVQSFNGSASLLYYSDDAGRNDASTALRKILRVGGVASTDAVDLRLRLVDGNRNSDVRLNAFITSVDIGSSVGEVSRADITFQATGSLVEVTL
jgi:hypothetical protein